MQRKIQFSYDCILFSLWHKTPSHPCPMITYIMQYNFLLLDVIEFGQNILLSSGMYAAHGV